MMIFKRNTRRNHACRYSCLMRSQMSPTIGQLKLGMPGLPASDPLSTGKIPLNASIDGPILPTFRDQATERLWKNRRILLLKLRQRLQSCKMQLSQCGTAQICSFLHLATGRGVWRNTMETHQSFSFQCCRIYLGASFQWPTCTTRSSKTFSPITLRESITMQRV